MDKVFLAGGKHKLLLETLATVDNVSAVQHQGKSVQIIHQYIYTVYMQYGLMCTAPGYSFCTDKDFYFSIKPNKFSLPGVEWKIFLVFPLVI